MSSAAADIPEADLPDHYEVVNGQVVEIAPRSVFASEIANRLRDHLMAYVLRTNTGRTRMDMMFHIPLAKVYEYLRAGAELVWVIFPRQRQLFAYTAPDTAPRVFTAADTIDGGNVLPGLSVSMVGLFPAVADEPQAEDDE